MKQHLGSQKSYYIAKNKNKSRPGGSRANQAVISYNLDSSWLDQSNLK